jgi:tripartite-type tricarboxylate transporter receptor subunit TctC
MRNIKRFAVATALLASLLAACEKPKEGQSSTGTSGELEWPTRSITIQVPAAPGGGTDVSARLTAKYMEKILGKPIVIVNTAGASGGIAASAVRQSTDNHTFLYFHNSLLIANIFGVVDFVAYEALDPVATGVADPSISLFVRSDSDIRDLADLAQRIRAKPETIRFAMETGGNTNLLPLAFQDAVDGKFHLIDAGPDSEKVVAVLGGFADVLPTYFVSAKQYLDSGDLRCLGLLAANPNPLIPDVTTARQQGLDFDYPGFVFVYYAKQGTNPEIIKKFASALEQAVKDPALQAELKNLSYIVDYHDTEETKTLLLDMHQDYKRYQSLIE